MADWRINDDHPDDQNLEEIFDLDAYYVEDRVDLAGHPDFELPQSEGQQSRANDSPDEIQKAERELELIELRLRRHELQERLRELRQKPQLSQQEQPFECPRSHDDQKLSPPSHGVALMIDWGRAFDNTSQVRFY